MNLKNINGVNVNNNKRLRFSGRQLPAAQGFTLISVVITIAIISTVATGSLLLSLNSENIAETAIQRSRAFHAADGATMEAQRKLETLLKSSLYGESDGSSGVFSAKTKTPDWWRENINDGVHEVDSSLVLGVVRAPLYIIEEIGDYVTDGGTGVVSLDVGSAAYGRNTSSGREVVMYNVESHAKGSYDGVNSAVATVLVYTR